MPSTVGAGDRDRLGPGETEPVSHRDATGWPEVPADPDRLSRSGGVGRPVPSPVGTGPWGRPARATAAVGAAGALNGASPFRASPFRPTMPPPAPPGARLERSPRLAPPLPVRLGRRILRHRVAVEAAVALVLLGALTAGFWPTAQPARSAAGRWAARAAPYVARLAADTASQPGRLAADVTRARRDVPPAPVNRWEATWQFALSQLAAGNRAGGGAALVALTQMTEQATSPRP